MQRILKVDGSSLWYEPENQFVLRYNDLSDNKQEKLAERIVACAPQARLRRLFSLPKVIQLLQEINPVVLAEGKRNYNYTHWRRWNRKDAYSLTGRNFHFLAKLVYRFLCLKRPPQRDEYRWALLEGNAGVSSPGFSLYDRMEDLLDAQLPIQPTPSIAPAEISQEDIRRARERAENQATSADLAFNITNQTLNQLYHEKRI